MDIHRNNVMWDTNRKDVVWIDFADAVTIENERVYCIKAARLLMQG